MSAYKEELIVSVYESNIRKINILFFVYIYIIYNYLLTMILKFINAYTFFSTNLQLFNSISNFTLALFSLTYCV